MAPGHVSERIAALNFAAEDGLHFDAYAWYVVDIDWLTSGAIGYLPLWTPVARERHADRPMVPGKPTKALSGRPQTRSPVARTTARVTAIGVLPVPLVARLVTNSVPDASH